MIVVVTVESKWEAFAASVNILVDLASTVSSNETSPPFFCFLVNRASQTNKQTDRQTDRQTDSKVSVEAQSGFVQDLSRKTKGLVVVRVHIDHHNLLLYLVTKQEDSDASFDCCRKIILIVYGNVNLQV